MFFKDKRINAFCLCRTKMENYDGDEIIACVLCFEGAVSNKCSLLVLDKTLTKTVVAETPFRMGCGIACIEGAYH